VGPKGGLVLLKLKKLAWITRFIKIRHLIKLEPTGFTKLEKGGFKGFFHSRKIKKTLFFKALLTKLDFSLIRLKPFKARF